MDRFRGRKPTRLNFVERLGARLGEPVATESRARFAGAVGAALLAAEGEGRRS